jgi:peptidyl-prolyl cis-trans isomerase C
MSPKKVIDLGVLSICVSLLLAAGCGKKSTTADQEKKKAGPEPAEVQTVQAEPEILIEVNGEKLTSAEAKTEVDRKLAGAKGRIPPDQMRMIRARLVDQTVERFVLRTILTNEVLKSNIVVTDEEINSAFDKFKAGIPKGMTFEDVLRNNAITEAKLREELAIDTRINKLLSQVTNGLSVAEQEVTQYMEQNKENLKFPETVRARHILVQVAKTDDDKAKADKKTKIEKLRQQLVDGADFAKLATDNSDCPSKEMGGDLGRFKKGQMQKPFEDAAFAQATNVIGPIVETEYGYHVIQVMEHQAEGTATKAEVTATLLQNKCDGEVRKYVGSLVQKAQIKDYRAPQMAPPPPAMPMNAPQR